MRALSRIVGAQAFANLPGLHAHRGVVTRVVAGRAAEDLDPDGTFLERFALSVQRVFRHVAQKFLAALAGAELVARQDAVQLLADLLVAVRTHRTDGPRIMPQRHVDDWSDSNRSVTARDRVRG